MLGLDVSQQNNHQFSTIKLSTSLLLSQSKSWYHCFPRIMIYIAIHFGRKSDSSNQVTSFCWSNSNDHMLLEDSFSSAYVLVWIYWLACCYPIPYAKRINVPCCDTFLVLALSKICDTVTFMLVHAFISDIYISW